jgi:putative chitinase
MPAALNAFPGLFQRSAPDPSVAAAITVLANPPPPPASRLDAAIKAVAPHLADTARSLWMSALTEPLARFCITSPRCVAAFLGQCAVESGGFRSLEEDLNYSAERLCQVWPNRFPSVEAAAPYAAKPDALANQVYANRLGNGDPASGDGWRFRGRGLIQITGRAAYEKFARAVGMTVDDAVAHAASPAGAAESAVWFWTANALNPIANSWAIDLLTRKINGGLLGAAERARLCQAALTAIGT